ncbi:hypothetical protein RPQ02_40280 [Streptomyces sp. AM2-3-1]|uniref:hypothetical protein n=1 Tax=Streptomyces sp. AM2-3-1 TaxID=3075824 RepID=UPI0028C4CA6D|nr:hypothetical protein [Streptomyces sp. AM2-3-1]WNO62394.1 hypothetical protein RPQ02_00500 [Streptomyces sp. AM2-3-1]WNO69552.1 hypothetical protein RPQ02_40280 [Streptomyces sp. AM2-3-1]
MTPPPPTSQPAGDPGLAADGKWCPTWQSHQATLLPPVTVVVTTRDDPQYMRRAFAAHQPRHGRITIHPTPLAGTGAFLAHDLIRAFGKHLPVPDDDHGLPAWTNNSDRSWRITAAWILTLGITHLTACRAHRISAPQWEHLLALSARTGARLTLLCNGPIPPQTAALLDTIPHRRLDDLRAAAAHWRPPAGLQVPTGYRWWQHNAPFPPRDDELSFRLPPQPHHPITVAFTPAPNPTGPVPPLPLPGPHHDPSHPHTAQIANRIHTRIAHPVHAACVALRTLTGYSTQQIKALHTHSRSDLPPLPPWAHLLLDAARQLADLHGHPDAPNPLSTPRWEHPEIEQALHACRLLPTPPSGSVRPARAATSRTSSVRATTNALRARPTS